MENKYFTPDMEDVRIGMEYYYLRDNNEFILFILTEKEFRAPEWIESLTGRKQSIFTYLQEGKIKVAYLTKEQIEAEGWKFIKHHAEIEGYEFEKDEYSLYVEFDFRGEIYLKIYSDGYYEEFNYFSGKCKDINTFRKICKLLEI